MRKSPLSILFYSSMLLSSLLGTLAQSDQLCGNGRLDAGEACDPGDPTISSDCCSNTCQLLPPSTACSNGFGVCSNDGKCTTRASICSSFSNTVFRVPASSPAVPLLSIQGPYGTCYPNALDKNEQKNQLENVKQNKQAPSISILSEILPASYLTQTRCSLACMGKVQSNQTDSQCIDFGRYQNIPSRAPDYIGCAVDRTTTADYARLFASSSAASSAGPMIEKELLPPGICVTGVCRTDVCRSLRCSNHGECALAQGALSALSSKLGLPGDFAGGEKEPSLVQCRCDAGFTGPACQFRSLTDSNSTVPNGNGTAVTGGWDKDKVSILAGSIVGALLFASLVAVAVVMFLLRKKKKNANYKRSKLLESNDDEEGFGILGTPLQRKKNKMAAKKAINDGVQLAMQDAAVSSHLMPSDHSIGDDSIDTLFASAAPESKQQPRQRSSSDNILLGTPMPYHRDAQAGPSVPEKIETAQEETESADITTAAPEIASNDLTKVPAAAAIITDQTTSNDETGGLQRKSTLPQNYLRAAHIYVPRMADEIELAPGDILYLIKSFDDGWARAYNVRTGKEGIFPLSFAKKAQGSRKSKSFSSFATGQPEPQQPTEDAL